MLPTEPFFFDLEVIPGGPQAGQVIRWASLDQGVTRQGSHLMAMLEALQQADYLCAHNLLAHDARFLPPHPNSQNFLGPQQGAIDTLWLSSLLLNQTTHHLEKTYRLSSASSNDPVEDVHNLRKLFWRCLEAWKELSSSQRLIYQSLLNQAPGWQGFLSWLGHRQTLASDELNHWIQEVFKQKICLNKGSASAPLASWIQTHPVTLAYALGLIQQERFTALTGSWLQRQLPELSNIIQSLRTQNCGQSNCSYCQQCLNPQVALQRFFGFDSLRSYGGLSLQQEVITASLQGASFLAVLPTGAGKSLMFQLPALMLGEACGALTVVISPLQSLMQDQVTQLKQRFEIQEAVCLHSALSQRERQENLNALFSGQANLLYLAPESLRSYTVLRLLQQRHLARIVIDEAHCLSAWGQDFRVDYLYLARFLRELAQYKGLKAPIPVSCFSATAREAVVQDILGYFQSRMKLSLDIFQADPRRNNLHFQALASSAAEKYKQVKDLLKRTTGPCIIYAIHTRTVEQLAQDLCRDGFSARPFHGQLDTLDKQEHMLAFMQDEIQVMVATSAFGMGVDKANICQVIHYELPASLEDYLQQAGRAGRDARLQATCSLLYDPADLDLQFQLLNHQRLNQKEINQVWAAVKKQAQSTFSRSSLELAQDAGWDTEQPQLETRLKSALAALEEAQLLERDQNATLILAEALTLGSIEAAQQQIELSTLLNSSSKKMTARRLFQYLRARSHLQEPYDLRFDWICTHLNLSQEAVHEALNALRQLELVQGIQAQSLNLLSGRKRNRSSQLRLEALICLTRELVKHVSYAESESWPCHLPLSLKEFHFSLKQAEIDSSLSDLKMILRWVWPAEWLNIKRIDRHQEIYLLSLLRPWSDWQQQTETQILHWELLLKYLHTLESQPQPAGSQIAMRQVAVDLQELKKYFDTVWVGAQLSLHDCEALLLDLHRLQIIQLRDGLNLLYTRLNLRRLESDNRRQFNQTDYLTLKKFYAHKAEQIHIVGAYAEHMLQAPQSGQSLLYDYFSLPFDTFLRQYFPRRETRQFLKQSISQLRFEQIFGSLSPEQLALVQRPPGEVQRMLVVAGPGSGKTRILVHKVAALLLLEEVKPEQFLMLTFSRPAAQEMRQRLLDLLGKMAWQLDIFTFHAYAFQLLEQRGESENLADILAEATTRILHDDLPNRGRLLQKSVILVDEYQDISELEYNFLQAILKIATEAGDPRMLVVGDDDQNIYEFRGSSTRFLKAFAADFDTQIDYLTQNFRSAYPLVALTNRFISTLPQRLKAGLTLEATRSETGELGLFHYPDSDFYLPMIAQIQSYLQVQSAPGTQAVLCATNQEALMLETLLRQAGLPARLLLQLDHFQLKDLLELQLFNHFLVEQIDPLHGLISPGEWQDCRAKVQHFCKGSEALGLLDQLLELFRSSSAELFLHEWKNWLQEIRWEDLYDSVEQGVILVSTMHKAKGKEFDSVWLYLDHFRAESEASQRVLYVAMTRARNTLMIHTRHPWFKALAADPALGMKQEEIAPGFPRPKELKVQLGLKDIYLGALKSQQRKLQQTVAGIPLQVLSPGVFFEPQSRLHLPVSKRFRERWLQLQRQGYQAITAELAFIVIWHEKETRQRLRVPLPRVFWRLS